MTIFVSARDIRELATAEVCQAAAELAMTSESAGLTQLPPRIDVPSGNGFIRVMPAVLDDVMGVKVMTLAEGIGTRYLVLLFAVQSGEMLGVFDADELTRLRTATYTAVAAQLMVSHPPTRLAVLGSGFEAEGHLRALARMWPLTSVTVFSPSRERRSAFATRMSEDIGVAVAATDSTGEAVSDASVVLLATKSRTPVVDGDLLPDRGVVLSIGSTRPDLRELDRATFRRSGTVVVDDPAQVAAESGDVIEALREGDVDLSRFVPVSTLAGNRAALRRDPTRDLLTFKSVGTALQDLALARRVLEAAQRDGGGRELGELSSLKRFADRTLTPGGRR